MAAMSVLCDFGLITSASSLGDRGRLTPPGLDISASKTFEKEDEEEDDDAGTREDGDDNAEEDDGLTGADDGESCTVFATFNGTSNSSSVGRRPL